MSPDIGLYQTKHAVRGWLDHIPGVERLQPNHVSLASLAPSGLAAVSLWFGWWPLVVIGIAGRMALTVMDGLLAEAYDKRSRIGPYLNRLPQEIGDIALFLALIPWADIRWVALLLGAAWLVNVLAVLPGIAGGSPQPAGPAGQPDRIALVHWPAAIHILVAYDATCVLVLHGHLSNASFALRISLSVRELGPV